MNLAPAILGSTTVAKLKETAGAHLLQVGSDWLTRAQLAKVECYNFHAARNLSHILHKVLGAPNLRHVYDHIPPTALAVPRMGVVSLAVLGAAFEAKGIGGDAPLESYVRKHATEGNRKTVTFDTIKAREQAEATRERKDKKRRKAQRRDQAHGMRVARFTEKQAHAAS